MPQNIKAKIFIVVSILIAYSIFEGLSFLGMKFIERNPDPRVTSPIKCHLTKAQRDSIPLFLSNQSLLVFDKEIGWLHPDHLHVRSNREITQNPLAGRFRIAAFGDSFTHGDEVTTEEAFPELLNTLDSRLDSLNLGVSRFGLDQAYLNYLANGVPLKPRLVLICFMPENILCQVNVFRPFYAQGDVPPLTKPRFMLKENKLILKPNPFQEAADYNQLLTDERRTLAALGTDDFFASNYAWNDNWEATPGIRLIRHVFYTAKRKIRLKTIMTRWQYQPHSEALDITSAIMSSFSSAAEQHGSEPVIVVLPRYQDLWVYVAKGQNYYAPLLSELNKRHLNYIDALDAFLPLIHRGMSEQQFGQFREKYFTRGEHYSAAGHKCIAEYLYHSFIKPKLEHP